MLVNEVLYEFGQVIHVLLAQGNYFLFRAIQLDIVHVAGGPGSTALPQAQGVCAKSMNLIWAGGSYNASYAGQNPPLPGYTRLALR
jgi:hypothetical protein